MRTCRSLTSPLVNLGLLVTASTIGACYMSWSKGLSAGLGGFAICILMYSIGFTCLAVMLQRISLTQCNVPGPFNTTRCNNFYQGFMIGSCQSFAWLVYSIISMLSIADVICISEDITDSDTYLRPVSFVSVVVCISILILQSHYGWAVAKALSLVSFLFVVVFCAGHAQYFDIQLYGQLQTSQSSNRYRFHGLHDELSVENGWFRGISSVFHAFPSSAIFFIGLELIAIESHDKPDARPIDLRWLIFFITALTWSVILIASGTDPGANGIVASEFPLIQGFERILGTGKSIAGYLCIPPLLSFSMGYMKVFVVTYSSMARSSLFPSSTPTKRFIVEEAVSIAGIVAFLIFGLVYALHDVKDTIYRVGLALSLLSDIGHCYVYHSLGQKRSVDSKYGMRRDVFMSVGTALIFLVCLTGVLAFQNDYGSAAGIVLLLVLLLSCYYWMYAVRKQEFSEDELAIILKSMVVRFNQRKSENMRLGNKSRMSRSLSRRVLPSPVIVNDNLLPPNDFNGRFTINKVTPVNGNISDNQPKDSSQSISHWSQATFNAGCEISSRQAIVDAKQAGLNPALQPDSINQSTPLVDNNRTQFVQTSQKSIVQRSRRRSVDFTTTMMFIESLNNSMKTSDETTLSMQSQLLELLSNLDSSQSIRQSTRNVRNNILGELKEVEEGVDDMGDPACNGYAPFQLSDQAFAPQAIDNEILSRDVTTASEAEIRESKMV